MARETDTQGRTDGAPLPPYAPWCPRCRHKAQAAAVCPACGLGLVGAQIERLAQTDARIAELVKERDTLRAQLSLTSGVSGPATPAGPGASGTACATASKAAQAGPPLEERDRARRSGLASPSVPASSSESFPGAGLLRPPEGVSKPGAGWVPGVHNGLTVRQVLLGLGAACLLAAATAFLALVWTSLGAIAQVAVMVVLTALLFVVAVTVARRREGRFAATAEAVAVIATGLALIDVVAGRTLHVPGLATMPLRGYALLAVVVLAVAFAGVTARCAQLRAPAIAAVAAVLLIVPIAIVRSQSSLLLMVAATISCVVAAGMVRMLGRGVVTAPAFRVARWTAQGGVVLASVIATAAAVMTAALDARVWAALALVPSALTVVADRMMGSAALPPALPDETGQANRTGEQTRRIVASVGGLTAAYVLIVALHGVDFGMMLGLLGMGLLLVCGRGMQPTAHRILHALISTGAAMALAGYVLALAQGHDGVILILALGATVVATIWSVAPRRLGVPVVARAPSALAAVLFAAQAVTTAAWSLHEGSGTVAAGAALVGWSATALAQGLRERDIRHHVALTGLGVAVAATGTAVAAAAPVASVAALLSLVMVAASGR